MKILITDKAHPVLEQRLAEAGHQVVVDTSLDYPALLACAPGYDALVVRSKVSIDRPFLRQAGGGRLRCIGRLGAGMETIDVDFARECGICCLNSPEGNMDAVGEHTLALLLSLFDRVARADAEVRQGLWQREANRGLEVMGKTVGIIGMGHMGGAFAQRLQGFGCRVVAHDLLGGRASGFAGRPWVEAVSLSRLQAEADVVSLHVPLSNQTFHLADEAFFSAFAKEVFLLNTSRGAVVDTLSLANALDDGRLRGAALDVMEFEDMASDGLSESLPEPWQRLLRSPRTVLTPHVAGWTVESKYKLAAVLADKMIEALR